MLGRLVALAGALTALAMATPANGATGDPVSGYPFVPTPTSPPFKPPPVGYFIGPCGLAVDSSGRYYVSDYYHHAVDVYDGTDYVAQLANVDPLDGPCGLALDSSNRLYVNDFDRDVVRYGAAPAFGSGTPIVPPDTTHPTGVAVDPATNDVYVDNRTSITGYSSSGTQLMDGTDPLKVGDGTLGEAYGLAVDSSGRLFVADASDNKVKAYDPAISKTAPQLTISGPPGGFVSLRHASLAVDQTSGVIYVVDNQQPSFAEEPAARVDVFTGGGSFLGVLKYEIADALPAGLAVDNSAVHPGRVYVTSGNTDQAGIYAYPPGSQVSSSLPPAVGLTTASLGSGTGTVISSMGDLVCATSCTAEIRSGAAVTLSANPDPGFSFAGWSGAGCQGTGPCTVTMNQARSIGATFTTPISAPSSLRPPSASDGSEIVQKAGLRLKVIDRLAPHRLPRADAAPIAVTLGWEVASLDGSPLPDLHSLSLEINRHGRFDYTGLPLCPLAKIQPASTSRALTNCRSSLVGTGSFSAETGISGQKSSQTSGRLLIFNGRRRGKAVLLVQIYSPRPYPTSFVIPFDLKRSRRGAYGTALQATLPKTLSAWGKLTGMRMTLFRRYNYGGKRHSFISAACPAPKGIFTVGFPLARTSFSFQGNASLGATLSGHCSVRGS